MYLHHFAVGSYRCTREQRVLEFAPLVGRSRTAQRKQIEGVGILGKLVRQRHPEVAAQLVNQLDGFPDTPILQAAAAVARSLTGVMGFAPPSWHASAAGVWPEPQPEEFEIRSQGGWQHEAASRVERTFRDVDLFSRLDDPAIAMLRSLGGPGAGLAVSTCLTCRITRM